jgi:hypothetical protein
VSVALIIFAGGVNVSQFAVHSINSYVENEDMAPTPQHLVAALIATLSRHHLLCQHQ